MKTFFEEPELKVIQFNLKEDILSGSNETEGPLPGGDEDELTPLP